MCFVHNCAQREGNQALSIMQLSGTFRFQPIRVKIALDNKLEASKARDHSLAVDENSEAKFLEWIDVQAEKCNPVTRIDIRHYCEVKHSISISRRSVDSFIFRHRDDLTETKNTPQEETRLEVPCTFLDETICYLRKYIQEMKAELVFNLDEVVISEW
jgi:hypothetical protein